VVWREDLGCADNSLHRETGNWGVIFGWIFSRSGRANVLPRLVLPPSVDQDPIISRSGRYSQLKAESKPSDRRLNNACYTEMQGAKY
jgi:hypothetical protein